jgi:chromatin segregation and condensation protein Rec8/ScpA/Scc1 (kleisin family)
MGQEKPFYLRPPWEILFSESILEKVSPWSIDLAQILSSLLEEMNRVGLDFRMAGVAVNSSALIYLRKAELLLVMEEPPLSPQEEEEVYVPPPLSLPFRFQLSTTSVYDLINALERVLSAMRGGGLHGKIPIPVAPISEPLEEFIVEVEEDLESHLGTLYEKIRSLCGEGGAISLTSLLEEGSRLEIVRVFIRLLYLAQRGKITLEQGEDEGDIKINILRR